MSPASYRAAPPRVGSTSLASRFSPRQSPPFADLDAPTRPAHQDPFRGARSARRARFAGTRRGVDQAQVLLRQALDVGLGLADLAQVARLVGVLQPAEGGVELDQHRLSVVA